MEEENSKTSLARAFAFSLSSTGDGRELLLSYSVNTW